MPLVSKAADANEAVGTGWTNPTNAYADDGTVASFSGANGTTWTTDYGFPDFSSSDIPDGSTINAVTMRANVWQSNASRGSCGVQGRNNGANSGSEATSTSTSTSNVVTATLGTVTLSDLRSASTLLKARVRCSRTASQAFTGSLDYVEIVVDYTPPGVTGSGGIQSAASDIAGTGAERFTGSAAVAAVPSTLAAAGAERFTGSGSVATAPSVLAGEGTGPESSGFTGSGSVVAAASQLAATGQIRFLGAAGVASPASVVAGEGAVVPLAITGAGGIVSRPSLVAGAGALPGSGQATSGWFRAVAWRLSS
jgi:hypothetical protein